MSDCLTAVSTSYDLVTWGALSFHISLDRTFEQLLGGLDLGRGAADAERHCRTLSKTLLLQFFADGPLDAVGGDLCAVGVSAGKQNGETSILHCGEDITVPDGSSNSFDEQKLYLLDTFAELVGPM